MTRNEIARWLREESADALKTLWQRADDIRRVRVGDEVHLRGLVEFSNYCARRCFYCGLRAPNTLVRRYRMNAGEVLECAHTAVALGYGTLVLQSGEDPGLDPEWLAGLVRALKTETDLAVTLSVGERTPDELRLWRQAGADRYLLRFETSEEALFQAIHPPRKERGENRKKLLGVLRDLGYEVGSGVLIGIPGQTYASLANDIALFNELDLDMIGVGPFIPHPATPIGQGEGPTPAPPGEQVPNTEIMTYKVVALTRTVRPLANIPSTTALATLNQEHGRESGLCCGANVIMPNITPMNYRKLYDIYPNKACTNETPERFHADLLERLRSIGRRPGIGRGDSLNYRGVSPKNLATATHSKGPSC